MPNLRISLVALLSILTFSSCLEDADDNGVWRFGCIGDSNAVEGFGLLSWCGDIMNQLGEVNVNDNGAAIAVPVAHTNFSRIGATACVPPPNHPYPDHGGVQVQRAISHGGIDALLISLGTNDITMGKSATALRDCLISLRDTAANAGIQVFVASVPPQFLANSSQQAEVSARIESVNFYINSRFAPRVIDFSTNFFKRSFSDSRHFNAYGRMQAANRARAAIKAEMNRQ